MENEAQRAKYTAYAEARTPRTAMPQGPARLVSAKDLVGPAEQIAEQLYEHPGFQQVRDVVFALPFSFDQDDDVQSSPTSPARPARRSAGGRAPCPPR